MSASKIIKIVVLGVTTIISAVVTASLDDSKLDTKVQKAVDEYFKNEN